MALTTAQQFQACYIANGTVGIAPGGYMTDLANIINANNGNMQAAVTAVVGTTVFTNKYPSFLSNEQFATNYATNLLGASVSAATLTEASTYVAGLLNAGNSRGTVVFKALEFLYNVSTTDAKWGTAAATLQNKASVGQYYTIDKLGASTDASVLSSVMTGVTQDAATVVAAKASIDAGNGGTGTGTTFTLTTGADTLVGTAAADTFAGINNATTTNFNTVDSVDGGAGIDTLKLELNGNYVGGAAIKNIEVLGLTMTAGGAFSTNGMTGLTDINVNAGVATTVTAVASVANVSVSNSALVTTVSYADAAVTGATDAVTVKVNNVTAGAEVDIQTATALAAGVETITVNSMGSTNNSFRLGTNDSTVTKLNVTGDRALTLTLGSIANAATLTTSATTIDASALTANLTLTGIGAAVHTVTGGTANDSVNFGLNFTSADSFDGGTGTDTLRITSAATQLALTAADWAKVKNVEVVQFTDGAAGTTADDVSQDLALLTGITGVNIANVAGVTANENFTFSNALNELNVTVRAGAAANAVELLTVGMKDASGLSDTYTLTLGASTDAASVNTLTTLADTAGLETLNIVANGASNAVVNTITNSNAASKLVITGDASLTITTLAAATQIDATALKGILTVSAYGVASGNLQGGLGNDILVGGAGAQTINGNAGNDSINGAAGADTLTGGAGVDTFGGANSFGVEGQGVAASAETLTASIANGQTITFGSGVDRITDFVSGTDKLDVVTANTAATSLIGINSTGFGVANTLYAVVGTFNTATNVFTVDTTATASTANVAMAAILGDGSTNLDASTGWVILTGVSSLAATDFA